MTSPPPPVLTVVRLVCRECLPLSGGNLPHVARLVDSFLDDFSDTLTLARGYLLSGGSLRLLQYLAAREGATMDPILRRWAFSDAVGYAAAEGDLETLRWLLKSYLPDEFLTKAVDEAASNGHLHVLEWLWANYRSRSYWGSNELCGALRNKHSSVVAWLRGRTTPRPGSAVNLVEAAVCGGDLTTLQWLIEHFDVDLNQAFDWAAREGQWDVAKWIVQNGELEAPPGESVSRRAAGDGDLEFLKLLSSRKPWTPDDEAASSMISLAAGAGHLEVVQWLHEELGINSTSDGYAAAAMGGHIGVLKYLHEKHLRNSSKRSLLDVAAEYGHLEVVQWLHENRSEECTPVIMHLAAVNGHLDVVKWLHANFSSEGWQELRLRRVYGGHCGDYLERVEWLDGNGHVVFSVALSSADDDHDWNDCPMDIAAERGYLDVVKWLHENRSEGCTTRAMNCAAERGRLEIVKWLHENRSEGCTDRAMDCAAANGHLEIVKWLHENRSEGCTDRAMDGAAKGGHLEIVKWLHENRSEGCATRAMDYAAERGHLKVVKWLHDNRSEGCTKDAMTYAASNNHFKVVKWLCRNRSEGCMYYAMTNAIKKGILDIAVLLHTERFECRNLKRNTSYPLKISRIEVAEWVLEHFPQRFKDCRVEVEPGDWHFGDWLERTNQVLEG